MEADSGAPAAPEWKEFMGKDVRIQTLQEGQGPIADMGSVVSCALDTYLLEPPPAVGGEAARGAEPVESAPLEQFKIGEGDAVPGLELALRHGRVGEKMRVQCSSRFCWGAAGLPQRPPAAGLLVPPHSDVEFVVTVLSHSVFYRPPGAPADEAYEETAENEAYLETALRKHSGTRWYRSGDLSRAGRCYSKAAEAAEKALFAKLPPAPPPELPPNLPADVLPQLAQHLVPSAAAGAGPVEVEPRWLELLVASLNNLAATHLQAGEPLRAREACIRALEVAPDNITTLLRAGRASLSLHEHAEALLCFQKVQRLDPDNAAVRVDLAKLKKAVVKYKEARNAMSKRMVKEIFKENERGTADRGRAAGPSGSGGDGARGQRESGGEGEGAGPSAAGSSVEAAAEGGAEPSQPPVGEQTARGPEPEPPSPAGLGARVAVAVVVAVIAILLTVYLSNSGN